MKRGAIYRTRERMPERGGKPGFYVVVSRPFIAENEDISTVVCAPIYRGHLGLSTEVAVGAADGLPTDCSIRCDFLALMFKSKLTGFVADLPRARMTELDDALARALGIEWAVN